MTIVVDAHGSPAPVNGDAALMAEVARGSPSAFERVVALHGARVARLAHRLLGWRGDADDVVQEAFLAVLRSAGRFRADAQLTTWLTAVTINACRARTRSWFVRRVRPLDSEGVSQATTPRRVVEDETRFAVRTAIGKLRPADREVIVLRYLEEMSPPEIARVLGLACNTVEVRLSRARARLGRLLSDLAQG